ncbi:MAG TPA: 3-oxoacyl-[acyl-carrier-protein] reductase [Geminicoccus sp.]|jgi:3-oxoacyl-[acyl-carrier protein] reductase|uniref:3-oxoacyl-[acyl-carrier-protein] reductase n=1 Tax=Geminicoccus sp. TaxID=2024832 RepID=UPI002E348F0B|nr:3-oxoacyl-[acyl-carrier-protein] reductase [Geminicoccus sp.]HEX2527476.1 3-oxoacyl-[acyl-carrier-protein] reductase [Geminicoccus sp.]
MFDLSARRALVTGATGGIGEAIARALHAQGASLVITGRRGDVLERLASELGSTVVPVVADLADPSAAEALMKAAEADGPVDILVNNAGITRDMLAMRMKDDDWAAVIETNLSAVFRLSRAGLKGMMKRRHGRIINIGSVVGTTGNPGQANYAAAKAGLVGMTKALAAELGSRGVTVNCVAPGFIDTAMTQKLDDKQKEALMPRIPAGRLGQGADVAAAVVYLASDEAGYVTGHTLHVNGGMAMI